MMSHSRRLSKVSDCDEEDDNKIEENESCESVEDVLRTFRGEWQKELNSKTENKTVETSTNKVLNNETKSDEDKAKQLFLKGAELENSGNMYEAIQHYKKSVQLVPDIEFRIYESMKVKSMTKDLSENSKDGTDLQNLNKVKQDQISDEDNLDNKLDLLSKAQKIVNENKRLCTCQYQIESTHISALPMEIILYILRWVVSSELDMQSLEKFGCTCRGFYLCSRDSEIWKLACDRAWMQNSGTLDDKSYSSWREMFINRPRLKFNGCYISKTTYVRHGENSFQDQFYRPWHLVEYYRYLRLFPDGRVLMLTTADEPAQCVSQLKYRNPKNSNILIGHFRQHDSFITIVVQKQQTLKTFHRDYRKRDSRSSESSTQIFQLELQIQSYKKRKHGQLSFIDYTVLTKYKNGTQMCSNFELANTRYPPLWFSKVKNYTAKAENIL